MRLTTKGKRITRRVAAEQLLANIELARRVGACKVWTEVKRTNDYVFELTVLRPK